MEEQADAAAAAATTARSGPAAAALLCRGALLLGGEVGVAGEGRPREIGGREGRMQAAALPGGSGGGGLRWGEVDGVEFGEGAAYRWWWRRTTGHDGGERGGALALVAGERRRLL